MKKFLVALCSLVLSTGLVWAASLGPCDDCPISIQPTVKGCTKGRPFMVNVEMGQCVADTVSVQGSIYYDHTKAQFRGYRKVHPSLSYAVDLWEKDPGWIIFSFYNLAAFPEPAGDCSKRCTGEEGGTMVQLNFQATGDHCEEGSFDLTGARWIQWEDPEVCAGAWNNYYTPPEDIGDGVFRIRWFNCNWGMTR